MAANRRKAMHVNAELLAALKDLIATSGHISPFGGEATVKAVRRAMKYMVALDKASAVIAKAEGRK